MAAASLVRLSSKGKQGGLEWDSLLPCVCYQKEIIPRSPVLSAFPLTSYRPELGHTRTPRPETGVLPNSGLSAHHGGSFREEWFWLDDQKYILRPLSLGAEALSSGPGPVSALLRYE